jgi:hypothetical protein
MPTLAEVRARAERHQDEIDRDTRFLSIADLMARWNVGRTTIRAIPASALPYVNLGNGLVRERRRYRPEDVEAYEEARRARTTGAEG